MKKLLVIPILLIFSQVFCQNNTIEKEKWHWNKDIKQDTVAGYTQVLKVDNVLYISGTVAGSIDEKGITAVYNSLKKSLASFGATFENVVKENLYATDIEAMKTFNFARKKFYKGDFPAATWIQVQRLYETNAKLEIESIAHLPK